MNVITNNVIVLIVSQEDTINQYHTYSNQPRIKNSDMKTMERIQDDARKYAIVHSAAPDKDTPDWIVSDYMAGAKSERNKTIDEAIFKVEDYCLTWVHRLPSDLRDDLKEILNSLKV